MWDSKQKAKLNSAFYGMLRIGYRDFRCELPQENLRHYSQRATPTEWYQYRTGALVIKIMMHKEPSYFWNTLSLQYDEEPRKPGLGRFF